MANNFTHGFHPMFLMCPPTYYRILAAEPPWRLYNVQSEKGLEIYQRNPKEFHRKAESQWLNFKKTLEICFSAKILTLEPAKELPDQTFTADASLSLVEEHKQFSFLSHFTHPKRQKETKHHERIIRETFEGREIVPIDTAFEGQGDTVYDPFRDVFWSGYVENIGDPANGRSSKVSHQKLNAVSGIPVHSLQVKRPFFHIDTCLAPLSGGHLLVYKAGMDDKAFQTVLEQGILSQNLNPTEFLIEVNEHEAEQYACNVINVGKNIVMARCGDRIPNKLRHLGYQVFEVDLSYFICSGGGPHCLVNYINCPRIKKV